MFYVYVIQSEAVGRYYIGYSSHPEKRLSEHNTGMVKSTKAYRPYKSVKVVQFQTRGEAMKEEKRLKRMKGGVSFFEYIKG